MRLPRMTTRRWMIAVATLAVILGGYREANRLKRSREEFLLKAARHAAEETDYRRRISSAESAVLREKTAIRELAAGAMTSSAKERNRARKPY